MWCQDITKSIEKAKNRIRNPPRGILTPKEKERLKNGQISRHMRQDIKYKTDKALIVDLPLIFEKVYDPSTDFNKSHYIAFIKLYLYMTKKNIERQRLEKGVKRKVSDAMVWRQIKKDLNRMYKNGVYQITN
jgi:hypothetical protein